MNPENINKKTEIKKLLLQHCISVLEKRIEVAKEAMNQAQESANSEGKSSAGDKYETSRAMGQLDRDMNARQLEEAQRDYAFVNTIHPEIIFDSARTGSLIETEKYFYFISIGLGNIVVDDQTYILVSPASPVAKLLEGKKAGEQFTLNSQSIIIRDLY
jgi:transcription elongation GreA/GreB family factor